MLKQNCFIVAYGRECIWFAKIDLELWDKFMDNLKKWILSFLRVTKKSSSGLDIRHEEDIDEFTEDGFSWIPDFRELLGYDWESWLTKVAEAKGGPKVLVATGIGGNSSLTPLDAVFALALTLRGAEVHFFLCDKALQGCQNAYGADVDAQKAFVDAGPSQCEWCFDVGLRTFSQLGLPIHCLSELLSEEDICQIEQQYRYVSSASIRSLEVNGVPLGEDIYASILRYYGRGDLYGEMFLEEVTSNFALAGVRTCFALCKLYESQRFAHTLINQGIYVPQGIALSVAKKFESHCVTWDLSYRGNCVMFCHDDYYLKKLPKEPDDWSKIRWTEREERAVTEYLVGRWSGKFDWIKYLESGSGAEPEAIAKELGIDLNKPLIGLLTNVAWDAQVFYEDNVFENMMEWIESTVRFFISNPNIQLVIRVHPAEIKSWIRSRQPVVEELKSRFGKLPGNIFVVPPESTLNTYKLMLNCDTVLSYATTASLEIACLGIPVVVAGEASIRGKRIGIDVGSKEQYKEILRSLPLGTKMPFDDIERAKKYAFHTFFRKSIPLGFLQLLQYKNVPYKIVANGLEQFDKGADEGLDLICDGILERSEFTYFAENMARPILI